MKVYIKCFSSSKNFNKIYTSFLEKVDTYSLKVDNNQIFIEFNNHIKLLRTIKFIDDLIDVELRKFNEFFCITVSNLFTDKE